MDSSELMFLFEITVDELRSFSQSQNHKIRARFGDVFTLQLKDPNQLIADAMVCYRGGRKGNRALKLRKGRIVSPITSELSSQVAVVASDVESLIQSMLNFPIEITHYSKDEPFVLGVVEIPWTLLHIDYLKNLVNDSQQPPVLMRETYKTYDEYTSKRVAVITLTIKLSQLKDNFALTTQIRSKYGMDNSAPREYDVNDHEIGTIRTIYSGGKYIDKSRIKNKSDEKRSKSQKNVVAADKKIKKKVEQITDVRVKESDKIKNDAADSSNAKLTQNSTGVVKSDADYSHDAKIKQKCDDIVKNYADYNILRVTQKCDENIKTESNVRSDAIIPLKYDKIIKNETTVNAHATIPLKYNIIKKDTIFSPGGIIPLKYDKIIKNKTENIHEICTQECDDTKNDPSNHAKKVIECACMSKSSSKKSLASLVRSQTNINNMNQMQIEPFSKNTKHWSSTSLEIKQRLDTLNYIFGNIEGPFGNKVYCVEYFTVENDRHLGTVSSSEKASSAENLTDTNTPAKTPTETPAESNGQTPTERSSIKTADETPATPVAKKAVEENKMFSMNVCDDGCGFGGPENPCFKNICELDLPEKAAKIIDVTKCDDVACDFRKKAAPLTDPMPDEIPILVDFGKTQTTKDCCAKKVEEKIEVFSGMTANLIQDPCSCTCECTFGFIAKTTYCNICGGYEVPGDEMKSTRGGAPFPCPIYHGWVKGKKGLSKKSSATGDESDKGKGKTKSLGDRDEFDDRESFKKKKTGRRKRDPRFKFNYGYKGIPPQIGHSQCAMPCTGDLNPVPKHMGWLWTANNIPGLKVRPGWRPGAANKHVVRMLRMAKFPDEILNKRRRRDTGKKKRPLKRPLLVVQKKDGEYNITMETMRTFTKPRAVNQYPYEDKPLVQYMVGRTDEENAERKKRKERAARRLEREQRAFLQSAFHDMCKEICLKTYQQALGMLPFAEDSWCPCFPDEPPGDRIDESHSCSCTESTRSSGSMTDDDEWLIEFTPPNAYYNPTRQIKKINTTNSSTQYTYLDYKVKLADRFGMPVPRFFIGPDGNQECSDLGGFWGPDKKWLEINVDGYIGPDGRWAPNVFVGPCGEYIDTEDGKFQTANGVILTVGVDGYIDVNGKWHFYPKKKNDGKESKFQRNVEAWKKAGGCNENGQEKKKQQKRRSTRGADQYRGKQSNATFSCFGDTSPHTLSQMGIAGHGHDRRLLLSTLEQLLKQGENVRIPQRIDVPKLPGRYRKKKPKHTEPGEMHTHRTSYQECKKHRPPPSSKEILAVNDRGHRTLFQLKEYVNPRAKQRMKKLDEAGISLSSFHVPCFSSFINSEVARQQQIEHILHHNARVAAAAVQT